MKKILCFTCLILIVGFSFNRSGIHWDHYIKDSDKFLHAIAYCLFTYFGLSSIKFRYRFYLLPSILLFSTFIEIIQYIYGHGRQFSLYDILANLAGIVIAFIIWSIEIFVKNCRANKLKA
jgi:VanZ family protein